MQRHLVTSKREEFQKIISGEIKFLVRFFRKRQEFLRELKSGDLVFLKVGKEILGQFNIGKVILVEKVGPEDYLWLKEVKEIGDSLEKEDFEKTLEKNSIALIVKIEKIEQLITSPIEVPIVRKDWIILE